MELPGVRVHDRIVRVLVATAVAAEQAACERTPADVHIVGVGPAAAAAGTAALLAQYVYDVVVCAGIAGGLNGTGVGQVVVADQIVFAGLGAETPDGFRPLSALGFGNERYPVDADLARQLANRTGGVLGTVLTVTTVTGSEDTLATLRRRHPDARAEAMEGAGVAAAAARFGVRYAELRSISNVVGPRDRTSWQIDAALLNLGRAVAAIGDLT
jgi:futalosine hydrolase